MHQPRIHSTVKHSANYTDLLRQFHAQWGRVSLRDTASRAYGTPRGTLPTYEQALKIHEYMLQNNGRPPGPGELR